MVKKTKETTLAEPACSVTMLIARILVVLVFAKSVYGKITGFSGSAGFAASSWIPLPGELLIAAAIVMELFAIFSILTGYKFKCGVQVLALYTFLATIMFHIGDGQMGAFLKNSAIIGGLLAMSMLKPGKFAIWK